MNVLEASQAQKDAADEAEWYYTNSADTKNRIGPVSFSQVLCRRACMHLFTPDLPAWKAIREWRVQQGHAMLGSG